MKSRVSTGIRIVLCWSSLGSSLFCGEATAQPLGKSEDSIEWMAADSTRIVRATIEKIEIVHKSSMFVSRAITLRVKQTLKGEHEDSLRFVNRGFGCPSAEDWKSRQCELLFFLNDGRYHLNRWATGHVMTRFPLVVRNAIELSPGKVAVYSRSLKRIGDPKELVGAVTGFLSKRKRQSRLPSFQFNLPRSYHDHRYTRVQLTVPVDEALQKLANAWLESPELAVIGGRALQRFTPRRDLEGFAEKYRGKSIATPTRRFGRRRANFVGVGCLEQMAVDCDAIARGAIEDFCILKAAPEQPSSAGVKLRVTAMLKGVRQASLSFGVADVEDLASLRERGIELLVFLKRNRLQKSMESLGMLEYSARSDSWDRSVVVLHEDLAEVVFCDLTWTKDPKAILKRLRAFLGTPEASQRTPTFELRAPASLVQGTSIAGNQFAVVYLPVNPQLETNARKWVRSTDKNLRWVGARALIFFKSDKNAELLRPLLEDDAIWPRHEGLRLLGSLADARLDIRRLTRWEAWNVLHGWGYDVTRPLFGK